MKTINFATAYICSTVPTLKPGHLEEDCSMTTFSELSYFTEKPVLGAPEDTSQSYGSLLTIFFTALLIPLFLQQYTNGFKKELI